MLSKYDDFEHVVVNKEVMVPKDAQNFSDDGGTSQKGHCLRLLCWWAALTLM